MNLKEKLKTRQGVIISSWVVGIILIIIFIGSMFPFSHSAQLAALVLTMITLSICVIITIFGRYIDNERFPLSAKINIGFTYFYSFMQIGLLSIDLAYSLQIDYNIQNGIVSLENSECDQHSLIMSILWNIVYWGTLLHGSLLKNFFKKYWTSGHFYFTSKLKNVFKRLLILIIPGLIFLAIFGVLVYTAFGSDSISGVKTAILIATTVYSMIILVILQAYGLFFLPLYLWKASDNQQILYNELMHADQIYKSYRTALTDLNIVISQCKNLEKHKTSDNSKFIDILLSELPEKDLEGVTTASSKYFEFDVKKKLDENYIANIRYQYKLSYFDYKTKQSKWKNLYKTIDQIIQKPVQFDFNKLKQLKSESNSIDNSDDKIDIILKSVASVQIQKIVFKILAALSLIFSLIVLATEATVIFNQEYTIPYIIVEKHWNKTFLIIAFTIILQALLTLICYFTIFNLKFLQFVPRNTNCMTFSTITSVSSKVITVLCFNFMVIIGEVQDQIDTTEVKDCPTSYINFYSSMIQTPFFGQNYNLIMSLCICILGLIFAILSILNLKNRAINSLKSYNERFSEGPQQLKQNIQKQKNKELTVIQQLKLGEVAFLEEMDKLQKKEDRKKLTRIGQQSIEMNHKKIELKENLLQSKQNELSDEEKEIQELSKKNKDRIYNMFKKRKISDEQDQEKESLKNSINEVVGQKLFKEGEIMKRSSKNYMIINKWKKKYIVLDNDKIIMYQDKSKKKAKKIIKMNNVSQVCFHYDQNAPKLSKHLKDDDIDDSRFDVHTNQRIYMFKSSSTNVWESQAWITILQQAAKQFSTVYGKKKIESDESSD